MAKPDFYWTGSGVNGSTACAVVRYVGATNTKGSRWLATMKRGNGIVWRGSSTFQEGPISAALDATAKAGVPLWEPVSVHNIDTDTYAIGF